MKLLLSFLPHVLVKNIFHVRKKNVLLGFLAAFFFFATKMFCSLHQYEDFSAIYRNGTYEHIFSLLLPKGNHGNIASNFFLTEFWLESHMWSVFVLFYSCFHCVM